MPRNNKKLYEKESKERKLLLLLRLCLSAEKKGKGETFLNKSVIEGDFGMPILCECDFLILDNEYKYFPKLTAQEANKSFDTTYILFT